MPHRRVRGRAATIALAQRPGVEEELQSIGAENIIGRNIGGVVRPGGAEGRQPIAPPGIADRAAQRNGLQIEAVDADIEAGNGKILDRPRRRPEGDAERKTTLAPGIEVRRGAECDLNQIVVADTVQIAHIGELSQRHRVVGRDPGGRIIGLARRDRRWRHLRIGAPQGAVAEREGACGLHRFGSVAARNDEKRAVGVVRIGDDGNAGPGDRRQAGNVGIVADGDHHRIARSGCRGNREAGATEIGELAEPGSDNAGCLQRVIIRLRRQYERQQQAAIVMAVEEWQRQLAEVALRRQVLHRHRQGRVVVDGAPDQAAQSIVAVGIVGAGQPEVQRVVALEEDRVDRQRQAEIGLIGRHRNGADILIVQASP